MTDDLVTAFVVALGPGTAGAESTAVDLLTRWSEPHRQYHTRGHLVATLDAVAFLLADDQTPPVSDPGAVELAVWFHDAVYTGRPGDDEEASANLVETLLPPMGAPGERVAEIARLVRLTAGHRPDPDDAAGLVLCDADLAILGADPSRYRAYAAAVRREYAHVPDAAFRVGRGAVLRGLVGATLYRTPAARRRWQAAAEANVAAELATLAR